VVDVQNGVVEGTPLARLEAAQALGGVSFDLTV
jgi:hypothetical protein